ncbi:hypothetical protein B0T19DRAFT_433478 [Cercophora scortea]|uniref:Uncharacterized protein n=1 Tax=Cercophora scortea TaxID=314031 RepID=A0AAE0I7K9_9PEZI|nr:hypothetical protein B0T19DRAFT_433478 [Cercophora scortea]
MYPIKSSLLLVAFAFAVTVAALAPPAPVVTAAPDSPEARALMLGLNFEQHLDVMARADPRTPNFFSGWYDPNGNITKSDECASKYTSLGAGGPSIGSALATYIISTYVRTVSMEWVYITSAGRRAGFACDTPDGNPPPSLTSTWESFTDAYSAWKTSVHSEGHVLATSCSGVFEAFFDYAVATDAAECRSEVLSFNQHVSTTASETSSSSASSVSVSTSGFPTVTSTSTGSTSAVSSVSSSTASVSGSPTSVSSSTASVSSSTASAAASRETGCYVVAVAYVAGLAGAMAAL